jgi:predicted amidohydrolase YtcJ
MRSLVRLFFLLTALAGTWSCAPPPTGAVAEAGLVEPADLIVRGGRVYTRPVRLGGGETPSTGYGTDAPAQAGVTWLQGGTSIAMRDGVIIHVGEDKSCQRFLGPQTQLVELEGATVVPGLVDAHGHVLGLGRKIGRIDLVGTASVEEVAGKVAARARIVPAGRWIVGRGWDQNDWPVARFPTREILDRVAPDHPVWLERIDGHASWVNTKELELAGLTAETLDPPGGRILKDPSTGMPTGVLVDRADALVASRIPPETPRETQELLDSAMAQMLAAGLTGVHDAGIDRQTLDAYRQLAAAPEGLPLRVYAMIGGTGPLLDEFLSRGPEIDSAGGMLTVRCLKLVADGALGSRGAALLEEYEDDPGNRGNVIVAGGEIERATTACLRAGLQVATHAIGDAGNRFVLDAYSRALSAVPEARRTDARLRVEHAQVVAPDDLPRFAHWGVLASMQPTHATSDMPWALSRVGPDRLRGAYAWRSLLETGARIPCGSDFPVESHRPLLGIYAAVSRQQPDGHPPGGWSPEETMTAAEALVGFTTAAAYAAFHEDRRGRIERGMDADLTVLSDDPLSVAPAEIPGIEVLYTIVAGRIRYERDPEMTLQDLPLGFERSEPVEELEEQDGK